MVGIQGLKFLIANATRNGERLQLLPYIAGLVVNYGISNTIVLEIP